MSDLFEAAGLTPTPADRPLAPLADRLRPRRLEDVVGQDHLLGGRTVRSDGWPTPIGWAR